MSADYSEFFAIRDEIMSQIDLSAENFQETCEKLPARKQFWIAKMIQYKIEIKRIEEQRDQLRNQFIEKMADFDAAVSKDTVLKRFYATPEVKKMSERIEVLSILIEYLNDVKFALGRTTDDIKNKIELDKLERL